MEEDTTTGGASDPNGGTEPQMINGVAVDDQGQAIPVPEESEDSPAAVETPASEPQAEPATVTEEADTGASTEALPDDYQKKLQSYAKGQGIDDLAGLSKREMSLLKSAYDTKADRDRVAQASGQLEQSMAQMSDQSAEVQAEATGADPDLLKRVQRQEVKASIRDFWDANPEARQYEAQMTEIASTAGLYGTPEAILKAAYAMAKASDSDNLKAQGRQEALETLRDKQQAAVPRGNAVSSTPSSEPAITPQNVDQLVGSHDLKWFEANRDAINKAMNG